MAVFIKKDRLGSRPPPDTMRIGKANFKGGTGFGIMADAFAKAREAKKAELNEKFESNAEAQRWRTLTTEEKARDAIERMVPTTKAVLEAETGKEASYEDARKRAESVAYKSEKLKDEK